MTVSQRAQLQGIENVLSAMLAELEPRVIMPSAEKQSELGIADETMLIPVGATRTMTVCATTTSAWSIKEFDTSSGGLAPIWEESGGLSNELVVAVVLGAALGSLQEQIEAGNATLIDIYAALKMRHTQLIDHGLSSFQFEDGS